MLIKKLDSYLPSTNEKTQQLLYQLIPQYCVLCHSKLTPQHKDQLCKVCEAALPTIDTCCGQCNTPLSTDSELCGVCLKSERHWDQCYAAYAYQYPISSLIHQLKYQKKLYLVNIFARLIQNRIISHSTELPDFFVPVPIHAKRLTERGFNQSLLLTKKISQQMGIPWRLPLNKSHHTDSQVYLTRKERQRQLAHSFEQNKQITLLELSEKHITIIDDVVTTGTTCTEMAKILKRMGARTVDIWCIART